MKKIIIILLLFTAGVIFECKDTGSDNSALLLLELSKNAGCTWLTNCSGNAEEGQYDRSGDTLYICMNGNM